MITNVRIGPAGWAYPDWAGIVYPCPTPRKFNALEYLSGFFDTLEINVSFYRPLPPHFAAGWLKKVAGNPNFRFTAKLWQRFTHDRQTLPTLDEVNEVHEGLAALIEAEKLGALLIQFPWSFRRTAENRQWLARVCDTFREYPLAVEIRHASWNHSDFYQSLNERHIAFCNIDQPLFDDSIEPSDRVTAKLAYIRLHGRNYENWFREDADRDARYDYLYSAQELTPWIKRIEKIREQAEDVYVITNNHYRGQAVVNAFEIEAGLGKQDLVIPQHMIDHFPQLARLANVRLQGQAGLPLSEK